MVLPMMTPILLTPPFVILRVPSNFVSETTVALRRLLRTMGTLNLLPRWCLTLKYLGVPTLLKPTFLNAGVTVPIVLTNPLGLPLPILTLNMLTLVQTPNNRFPFLTMGPLSRVLTLFRLSMVALPETIVIRPFPVAHPHVLRGPPLTLRYGLVMFGEQVRERLARASQGPAGIILTPFGPFRERQSKVVLPATPVTAEQPNRPQPGRKRRHKSLKPQSVANKTHHPH